MAAHGERRPMLVIVVVQRLQLTGQHAVGYGMRSYLQTARVQRLVASWIQMIHRSSRRYSLYHAGCRERAIRKGNCRRERERGLDDTADDIEIYRPTQSSLGGSRVLGLDLVQLLGTAQWCVHVVGVVEQRVIHFILARLLAERDHIDKAMAPHYLRGQVTAARLRCHARGLNDALCK